MKKITRYFIEVAISLTSKMRKELCHTVIAAASRDYLLQEGGEYLIEFIIRQSSIGDAEIDKFKNDKVIYVPSTS